MVRSNTRRRVSKKSKNIRKNKTAKKCKNVRRHRTTKGSKRSSSWKNRSMKKTTRKNKKGGTSSVVPDGSNPKQWNSPFVNYTQSLINNKNCGHVQLPIAHLLLK